MDSSVWVFWEVGSEEVEGELSSQSDVELPEVNFLKAVGGGVGGGESNFGDELEENFHFCFCVFLVASLPSDVLWKRVPISTSSKVRRELMSARASMAIVTLPRATIWVRCSRVA